MFPDNYQTLASVSMFSPILLPSINFLPNNDFQSNINYASPFEGLAISDSIVPIPRSASPQYSARPIQQLHGHYELETRDRCSIETTERTAILTPLSTPLSSDYFCSPSVALKPTSQDVFLCEPSSYYENVYPLDEWEDEGWDFLSLADHASSLGSDKTDCNLGSPEFLYPSDLDPSVNPADTINEANIPSLLPFLSHSPELRKLQKNEQLTEGIIIDPQYLATEHVGGSYQVIKLQKMKQDPTIEDDHARAILSSTDSNSLATPVCPPSTSSSLSLRVPVAAVFTPVLDAFRGIDLGTLQCKAIKYQTRNPGLDFDKSWLLQFAGRLSTEGQHTSTYRCYVVGCQQTNKRRDHILTHLGSHLNHRTFSCQYCPSRFFRRHDVKRHETAHHEKSRLYICTSCQQTFSRIDSMRRHIKRRHANEQNKENTNSRPSKKLKVEVA